MVSRTRCQICVAFIMSVAAFRFHRMQMSRYLADGSRFQWFEFGLNTLLGICWTRPAWVNYTIRLIICFLTVHLTSIFLALVSLKNLHYWGTYRTKYLLEAVGKWPEGRIVQAESYLDILLNMIIIKALEEIEKYLLAVIEQHRVAKKKRYQKLKK